MARIDVTAKVSGLHPVTGLYLVEGKRYSVEEGEFSDQVFDRVGTSSPRPAAPAASVTGQENTAPTEDKPTEGGGL